MGGRMGGRTPPPFFTCTLQACYSLSLGRNSFFSFESSEVLLVLGENLEYYRVFRSKGKKYRAGCDLFRFYNRVWQLLRFLGFCRMLVLGFSLGLAFLLL